MSQIYFKVLKEMIPTLSLQAGIHHLICVSGSLLNNSCCYVVDSDFAIVQKLVGDQTFGIMDLLRPSVKRTQGFFSVSI